MEDIFEELAAVSDDEGRAAENDQGGSGNRDDEAEEANDTRRVVKPKRVIVRHPRPKLDPTRLLGPRGIFTIKSTFDKIKFKGKGHELDDLNNVLSRLQHWAHRLFPKMTFEDCIDRIEELGNKKPIQTNMHKIRNGMIDLDSGQPSQDNDVPDDDRVPTPPPEDNAFDQLIAAAPAAPQTTLTDEQRARMVRNRLLAEERRMARRLAREKELEEQRRAGNRAAEESGNITDNTSNNGDVSADTTLNPTHDISESSSSSALKSAEASARSKDGMPSCVFDDPASICPPDMSLNQDSISLAPSINPAQSTDAGMDTTAAAGGEQQSGVLRSNICAGDASVNLPNDQTGPGDPDKILPDPAGIKDATASAAGKEECKVLGDDISLGAVVSNETSRMQDSSVAPLESATAPVTDGATAAASARIVSSSPPNKASTGQPTAAEALQVSDSDLMDVEHAPKLSLDSSQTGSLAAAEEHTVQSSSDKTKTPASQSQTPKPASVVDELMDVGSAEDWEGAFAEEDRALASQNQP